MAILGDDLTAAAKAVRNVRAARENAHEQLLRGRDRLRASSKTRKSVATRVRIMAAASELMGERGGTGFQMSEVSERCHMSKGALYYYFADKDELVQAVFTEAMDDIVADMERVVASSASAREALRGLCAEFARRMRVGSPLALALTSELSGHGNVLDAATTHLSRAVAIISSQLERAKVEGVVRSDVDATLAAVYVIGGYLMTSVGTSAIGELGGDGVLVDELMDITIAGIGAKDAVDVCRNRRSG